MSLHRDGHGTGPSDSAELGGDCEVAPNHWRASNGLPIGWHRDGSAPLHEEHQSAPQLIEAATECGWKPGDRGAEGIG
jgi:hypothetical protein